MGLSLENKVKAMYGMAVVTLACVIVFALVALINLRTRAGLADHTRSVLVQLQIVQGILDDGEIGALRALLLDDPSSGLQQQKAGQRLLRGLEDLSHLMPTEDNASADLTRKAHAEAIINDWNRIASVHLSQGAQKALSVLNGPGTQSQSRLRDDLLALEDREENSLVSRLNEWESSFRHVLWAASGIALTAIAMLGIIYGLVRRDIAKRHEASEQLRQSHQQLDERVGARTAALAEANNALTKEIAKHRQTAAKLRQLSASQDAALEDQRSHIAREIHDELGAALMGIKVQLNDHSNAAAAKSEELAKQPKQLMAELDSVMERVSHIATALRPSILDKLGVWEAIHWLVSDFEDRMHIACKLNFGELPQRVSTELATAVFRIVQETLTNVARHANASEVEIDVRIHGGELRLRVTDNGRGITEEEVMSIDSVGLVGMHERALHHGGAFHITGTPRKGTMVELRVPLGETT